MHPKLAAVFAEHDAPTHCDRRAVLAGAEPITRLAMQMQRQAAEYRTRLLMAEMDPDVPPVFRGKLEFLNQTVDAFERVAAQMVANAREAALVAAQFERAFRESKDDVTRASAATPPTPTAGGVRVP